MVIDSLKFSREKQTARGELSVAGLSRLQDSLFQVTEQQAKPGDARGAVSVAVSGKPLSYEVIGGVDARERPVLRLKVSGRLPLQCQRCLQLLDFELVLDSTLRLVPAAMLDAEMSDDPDEPDCVAASTELDLAALIEDEILLALPAYPRHEVGECSGAPDKETADGAVSKKVTAFSTLESRWNRTAG